MYPHQKKTGIQCGPALDLLLLIITHHIMEETFSSPPILPSCASGHIGVTFVQLPTWFDPSRACSYFGVYLFWLNHDKYLPLWYLEMLTMSLMTFGGATCSSLIVLVDVSVFLPCVYKNHFGKQLIIHELF